MSHAIIFTDRPPQTDWNRVAAETGYYVKNYGFNAGAYKIASVLRDMDMDCIVIPNCSLLSFAGVKRIIESNQQDLLWVGISTTLFFTKSNSLAEYREQWGSVKQDLIDNDSLLKVSKWFSGPTEIPWGTEEINLLADHLGNEYKVPLLIGGSWVTEVHNGGLGKLHSNVFIVTGYAENYVAEFSKLKQNNPDAEPPVINSNRVYDDHQFKTSSIHWRVTDQIRPDDWLPLEVSRGCAFNCAYCGYDRKSTFDNFKDPDLLREELIRNYELFGVTRYILVDDLYNDSKRKVRELYDRAWSRLPFEPEWTSYMRLDMFYADPDSIDLIMHSGARFGSFGIETLHDRAGKRVGKGLGKQRSIETLQALRDTWQGRVLVNGLFIAGLPYEPMESIQDTMSWCLETDLLFNANFTPMWITPPSHQRFVNKLTPLSSDWDKYGVTWTGPESWVNTEGVTNEQAAQAVVEYTHRSDRTNGLKLGFTEYADLRMGGLNHEDIRNIKTLPKDRLIHALKNIHDLVDDRLAKTLALGSTNKNLR